MTSDKSEPALVRLPRPMHDQIIAHAQREAPHECCGVIVGPPGELHELHELTNVYEAVDFYEPEPGQLFRVIKAADDRGWDITAIYHSHPVSVAYPSARDVEHAGWPDSIYLICSLKKPEAPHIRAFSIVDGDITERAIELV